MKKLLPEKGTDKILWIFARIFNLYIFNKNAIFLSSEFSEDAGEPKSAEAGIGDWFKLPELPKLPSIPSLFGGGGRKPDGPQAKLDEAQPLSFGDKDVSCNFPSFRYLSSSR